MFDYYKNVILYLPYYSLLRSYVGNRYLISLIIIEGTKIFKTLTGERLSKFVYPFNYKLYLK